MTKRPEEPINAPSPNTLMTPPTALVMVTVLAANRSSSPPSQLMVPVLFQLRYSVPKLDARVATMVAPLVPKVPLGPPTVPKVARSKLSRPDTSRLPAPAIVPALPTDSVPATVEPALRLSVADGTNTDEPASAVKVPRLSEPLVRFRVLALVPLPRVKLAAWVAGPELTVTVVLAPVAMVAKLVASGVPRDQLPSVVQLPLLRVFQAVLTELGLRRTTPLPVLVRVEINDPTPLTLLTTLGRPEPLKEKEITSYWLEVRTAPPISATEIVAPGSPT